MPCENPIAVNIVPVLMLQGFHFTEASLSINFTEFDANSSMNIGGVVLIQIPRLLRNKYTLLIRRLAFLVHLFQRRRFRVVEENCTQWEDSKLLRVDEVEQAREHGQEDTVGPSKAVSPLRICTRVHQASSCSATKAAERRIGAPLFARAGA